MKRIKLVVREYPINRVLGSDFEFSLDDEASAIDLIEELDKLICGRGSFPLKEYHSVLHMVYNPIENKFYKQVAVSAHIEPRKFLNVQKNPRMKLPNGTTVILVPAGGCISEWEEVIDYDVFCTHLKKSKKRSCNCSTRRCTK